MFGDWDGGGNLRKFEGGEHFFDFSKAFYRDSTETVTLGVKNPLPPPPLAFGTVF